MHGDCDSLAQIQSGAAAGKQDIETWRPADKADLIFANAALQFVPNHVEFMERLVSFLREGGWLAVQIPNNIHELSQALKLVRQALEGDPTAIEKLKDTPDYCTE